MMMRVVREVKADELTRRTVLPNGAASDRASRGGRGVGPRPQNEMTPSQSPHLEQLVGRVLRAGVTASSACLVAGLLLSLAGAAAIANLLLQTGIVVLLATPVARVFVSILEYAQQRDWKFTLLTAIVLVELLASAVAALIFNERL